MRTEQALWSSRRQQFYGLDNGRSAGSSLNANVVRKDHDHRVLNWKSEAEGHLSLTA